MLPIVNLVRNWLYDHQFLKIDHVPETFVVSIGNLTFGGTGKTPVAIKLLEDLQGESVALVTRGYGGQYKKKDVPLEVFPHSDPAIVGDEPLLIKRRVPSAKVIVDPDRPRGVRFAKTSIAVLDDGMQHRRLARDLEIVVVNGEDPFPFFGSREFSCSLKRADLVVVMGGSYTPSCPYVRMERTLVGVSLSRKKVGLFCGVGKPEQVAKGVKLAGAEIVKHWFLPDHAAPTREKLDDFVKSCENSGATVVLCTEKDWVKLPHGPFSFDVVPLQIQLKILEGQDAWDEVVKTCKRIRR